MSLARRLARIEARLPLDRLFDAETLERLDFYAERHGLPRDELIAAAEAIARQTAGMTPVELYEWFASEEGITTAELEAELASSAAAFERWRQERGHP